MILFSQFENVTSCEANVLLHEEIPLRTTCRFEEINDNISAVIFPVGNIPMNEFYMAEVYLQIISGNSTTSRVQISN